MAGIFFLLLLSQFRPHLQTSINPLLAATSLSPYFLSVITGANDHRLDFVASSLLLILCVMILLRTKSAAERDSLLTFFIVGLCGCLSFALSTYYFNESRSYLAFLQGLPIITAVAAGILTQNLNRNFQWAGQVILLGLMAESAYDFSTSIYRDAPISQLTARAEVPRLSGIYTTPERAQMMSHLYRVVLRETGPDDFVLLYDDFALGYFLFDRRPAYDMARSIQYGMTSESLERLKDRMLEKGRLPKLVLKTIVDISGADWKTAQKTKYDRSPIDRWVLSEYELIETVFPFEVWKPKSP